MKDVFKKHLNIIKECDVNNGENLSKCFIRYEQVKRLNGEPVNGGGDFFNQNTTSGLILNNGVALAFWLDYENCSFTSSKTENKRCGWFTVDVNGPDKSPNIWGKDIYLFFIHTDAIEPSSKDNNNYGRVNYKDDCETGTNYGFTCSAKYIFD